jgi:hypothetical protein
MLVTEATMNSPLLPFCQAFFGVLIRTVLSPVLDKTQTHFFFNSFVAYINLRSTLFFSNTKHKCYLCLTILSSHTLSLLPLFEFTEETKLEWKSYKYNQQDASI